VPEETGRVKSGVTAWEGLGIPPLSRKGRLPGYPFPCLCPLCGRAFLAQAWDPFRKAGEYPAPPMTSPTRNASGLFRHGFLPFRRRPAGGCSRPVRARRTMARCRWKCGGLAVESLQQLFHAVAIAGFEHLLQIFDLSVPQLVGHAADFSHQLARGFFAYRVLHKLK
jgi:hypothetical protein